MTEMNKLVIGWDTLEKAEYGQMILTPEELRQGFYINVLGFLFRTSYRIIRRLESGRYLVGDPKVEALPEFDCREPEVKC
jgi:hypothetical protein